MTARTRRTPGGDRGFAQNHASCGTQRRHRSFVVEYFARLERPQTMCCCCTIETAPTLFIDGITPATFTDLYPCDWHPGDEQVAA